MHYYLLLLLMFYANAMTAQHSAAQENTTAAQSTWISSTDRARVIRAGSWQTTSFRHAAARHLMTNSPGAALEIRFIGSGIVLRLGNHAVPAYGTPNLGSIAVTVDGKRQESIVPSTTPREIVVARALGEGEHLLRLEYQKGGGCRIEGFYILDKPTGDLQFFTSGEENAFLVDARAVLRQGMHLVRNTLVRNWLTGQCSLAGLPTGKGYTLELSAVGWQPVKIDNISIEAGKTTTLSPVYLRRDAATRYSQFRFPALNRPAFRQPGQTFRARFLAYKATIEEVRLRRAAGPAVISRRINFEEDKAASHYYDREVIAALPDDTPPGVYDLQIKVSGGGGRSRLFYSPRSVHVVRKFPTDPLLVTFGHLDTSGQDQAEYLQRLVSMINLIAPDVVLNSNAVNPAYISGAMSKLDMPYLVNFGNHQFHGHEKWYGDPVGVVDFGPDLCVLNFGHPWYVNFSKAEALLSARPKCRHKVINAFESNAPIPWLDKHKVCMIHDAHGLGEKVMDLGATPTRRIGKINSESFRVVRFNDGRVTSCTYDGHRTDPIPFGREKTPPLRVQFSSPNDGTKRNITATVTNDYLEDFEKCRLTFVLPRAQYKVDRGLIESSTVSDNKRYTVLTVRTDIPAKKTIEVRVIAQ